MSELTAKLTPTELLTYERGQNREFSLNYVPKLLPAEDYILQDSPNSIFTLIHSVFNFNVRCKSCEALTIEPEVTIEISVTI